MGRRPIAGGAPGTLLVPDVMAPVGPKDPSTDGPKDSFAKITFRMAHDRPCPNVFSFPGDAP